MGTCDLHDLTVTMAITVVELCQCIHKDFIVSYKSKLKLTRVDIFILLYERSVKDFISVSSFNSVPDRLCNLAPSLEFASFRGSYM